MLTLDKSIQKSAQESLKTVIKNLQSKGSSVKAGTAVAIDINTGGVICAANYPTYDSATMNKNYESFYLNELLPAIESKYAISKDKDSRIYYGTMYGADFGISLGMTNPDLFGEYWCFSPAHSSVEQFGMIPGKTTFRICWGTKETVHADNYYPSLLSGIKKRGGTVTNLTFEGRPSGMQWKEQFKQRLIAKFSYQTNR
jgi:hypothetical protein